MCSVFKAFIFQQIGLQLATHESQCYVKCGPLHVLSIKPNANWESTAGLGGDVSQISDLEKKTSRLYWPAACLERHLFLPDVIQDMQALRSMLTRNDRPISGSRSKGWMEPSFKISHVPALRIDQQALISLQTVCVVGPVRCGKRQHCPLNSKADDLGSCFI